MRKRVSTFLFVSGALVLLILTPVQMADCKNFGNGDTSLINQMAEQNFADPDAILGPSFDQLLAPSANGQTNETYQGIRQFWKDDLQSKILPSANHMLADWLNNSFIGYLSAIISTLSSVVKSFFLNPNLTQISNKANDLSSLLNQLANIVYGVALDLLFLLFIAAVWHYWTKASWNGNISAMSAVGRLICTICLVIAWPIIYSFEIELSNEMISAMFAKSADQLSLLDMIMASTFKASLYAGASKVITQLIPAANLSALGMASLGSFLSIIAWLALCILAIILIYQLVYLITLKVIQMALLVAQYVFAPVFLIFFATPSTEKIAIGYIRSFVETSMWTFIWIGLLRILIVLMYASFNPWGKILTAIGILQLMMQVPQFLGRFKMSAASDFVNPAILTSGLREKVTTYTEQAKTYGDKFVGAFQSALRSNNSQIFRGASNSMPAGFNFGQTSGYTAERPNKRQPYQDHSPFSQPNRSPVYQDQTQYRPRADKVYQQQSYQSRAGESGNVFTINSDKLPQSADINLNTRAVSESLTANKNMDVAANIAWANDSQTKNSASESVDQPRFNTAIVPIKKSSVGGKRDIFDKDKQQSPSINGNSSNSFPSQKTSSDLPMQAAALWDSSSRRQERNSIFAASQESLPCIEPFRINPFSNYGFSTFSGIGGFSQSVYPTNDFSSLTSKIMDEKLLCPVGASVLSKHQLGWRDSINLSGQEAAQNSYAAKSEADKFNQCLLGDKQNKDGNKNINYPSTIISGWRRPYYLASGKQYRLYRKPLHILSGDPKILPLAQFRSYYG